MPAACVWCPARVRRRTVGPIMHAVRRRTAAPRRRPRAGIPAAVSLSPRRRRCFPSARSGDGARSARARSAGRRAGDGRRRHRRVPGEPIRDAVGPRDGRRPFDRASRRVLRPAAERQARGCLHDPAGRLPAQRRELCDSQHGQRPLVRRPQRCARLRLPIARAIDPRRSRRGDHAHRPADPKQANCLSFNFRFLSEEYPEFVADIYNDAFVAELDRSNWNAGTTEDPRSARPATSPSTATATRSASTKRASTR